MTWPRGRTWAGRFPPLLVLAALATVLVLLIGVGVLVNHPGTAEARGRASSVLVAGSAGLRWADLSPTVTPTLWRLASQGSVGSLAARTASKRACPADGWLTLGAGNSAEWGGVNTAVPGGPSPGTAGPGTAGPGTAGPGTAGPGTAGPGTAGPGTAGPGTANPSTASPSTAGPASPTIPGPSPAARLGVTGADCQDRTANVARSDALGARIPEQLQVAAHNRALNWGAQPGALAESVRCTLAVGPGAAVAAARPAGRVDRYLPTLPANAPAHLRRCPLTIVELPAVTGAGASRAAAAARLDAALTVLVSARPENSLLLVAGLADPAEPSHLQVAIADGPGYAGGWLTSASTDRAGYLQLVDLAPTVLSAFGQPAPAKLFTGAAAASVGDHGTDLAGAVAQLVDADRQALARSGLIGRLLLGLAGLAALALLAAVPVLRRARVSGPLGPRPVPAGLRLLVECALAAAAVGLPAAFLADLVPWWRAGAPVFTFLGAWLVAVTGAVALVLAGPLRRRTLGSAAAVAAFAVVAALVDLLSGGWLTRYGFAGASAVAGGRFAGMGALGLGVLVSGLLLIAGCLAAARPPVGAVRRWRAMVVGAAGCVGIVMIGSPYLGADPAGAVAF
ncbi:MAG TPA: hypothetical protein VF163_06025, partial [Micromonosporaceae bacterium]